MRNNSYEWEYGSEYSASIKGGEFRNQLSNYQFHLVSEINIAELVFFVGFADCLNGNDKTEKKITILQSQISIMLNFSRPFT
jgi:hypothetical protein